MCMLIGKYMYRATVQSFGVVDLPFHRHVSSSRMQFVGIDRDGKIYNSLKKRCTCTILSFHSVAPLNSNAILFRTFGRISFRLWFASRVSSPLSFLLPLRFRIHQIIGIPTSKSLSISNVFKFHCFSFWPSFLSLWF